MARDESDPEVVAARAGKVRGALLRAFGFWSDESTALRGGRKLYRAAERLSLEPEQMRIAALDPESFQDKQATLTIHVWMLLQRLRADGERGKRVGQNLYDCFQEEVERRVREVGVRVRVGKWLKELEAAFYGTSLALDRAQESGEFMALPEAIWRNIYLSRDGGLIPAVELAAYVQRELESLALTPSDAVFQGDISFHPFHPT